VDQLGDVWLERYAQMTRETVQEARGTFTTGNGVYPLVPHMAWAEIIFDRHRPTGQAVKDDFCPGHVWHQLPPKGQPFQHVP